MFTEKNVKEINENFIKAIGDEWMLVSAGNEKDYNMMTASWGFVGEMWRVPVAVTVIRPSRYTKKFVDENEYFALSFYGDDAKKTIHSICGSKSGRDVNKTELCGLSPVFSDETVYFNQARLVLICKKMYVSPMKKEYIKDSRIDELYDNDYHIAYVGEIVKCLVNE